MFTSINHFEHAWSYELESTQKILKHITNKSLTNEVAEGHRSMARIAWHITLSVGEMMKHTGLTVNGPDEKTPIPATAKEILNAYGEAAISLLEQVKSNWNDETLQIVDEMYGEKWKRGKTLSVLINHQIHHRGQMTVLMRQAGLDVPGIYGPAKQEWGAYGMQEPSI